MKLQNQDKRSARKSEIFREKIDINENEEEKEEIQKH